ncbi:MAG: polysaccharide biosynthesis tyrosine autokinase [Sphingobacteriaceae bacterium]|nr:MAG: polysaccharide biosynthesis tyrosine autokinase [Sphingobacteriaceae bacterium]
MNDNSSTQYEPYQGTAETDNFNNLKYFLSRCVYHWPLFLIGVLITTGFAYFNVRSQKPSYEVAAKLLVNDGKSSGESSALEKLNVTEASKGIDNEIEILRSRPLVLEAIKNLNLWINYEEKGKYYQKDVYATTPVIFKYLSRGQFTGQQVFDVVILADNHFALLKSNGETINASFNNTFSNSFGSWKLEKTKNTEQYIGKQIRITLQNPDATSGSYQGRIKVAATSGGSNLLNVSFSDEVPERGKVFLDALFKNYVLKTKENKNFATANALKFLNTRLDTISRELNEAERKIGSYKSSNKFTDISAKGGTYLGNVQSNDAKLAELNIQLDQLSGVENYVNSSRNDDNVPVTAGVNDGSLSGLVGQLSTTIQQRNKLLATTPESNPIFDPINKQIKSIKGAIKETIRGVRSSLEITKNQLQSNNAKFESSFQQVPAQEKEFVNMTRQKSLKEDQFLYLSQQRETIALNYASTLSDVQIVDEPHDAGLTPSKAPLILSTAFLLGLLLPAGFVYGRNAIKNHIIDKREIESSTNTPVVSEINYEEGNSLQSITSRNGNIFGEQIRELRTKLLHLHQKNSTSRVTLFTSSTSGEGKSFITSSLGLAIAASGRKSVILELDLRKPKISKNYNLDPDHLGISDYLSGKVTDIQQIIQPSSIRPELFIIGAGSIPDNPSELLENYRMQELIDELKKQFNDILLDTPPIHLVTDAMIIANMGDVTLYIVRQGYTSKEELEFIKRIKKEKRLPNLNIVFNGVQNQKYGNSYHYDNSYYAKDTKKTSVKTVFKNFLSRF